VNEAKGSCYCGAVQWEFTLPVKTVVKCHCGMCRKLQGSDYSTWAVVPSEQFTITKGSEAVTKYQANEKSSKNFKEKGSSLPLRIRADMIYLFRMRSEIEEFEPWPDLCG